jgi:hypothetical protein
MWNPLHFCAYQGHDEVLKYLADTFQINIGKSAPKSEAQNEGDFVNDQERFIEDTLFILQIALTR